MTTTPAATLAYGPGASVTDQNGNVYTITATGGISVNGVVETSPSGIDTIESFDGVYIKTGANAWYSQFYPNPISGGWTADLAGLPIAFSISPDGTTTKPGGASLTDAYYNQWSVNVAGKVVMDGVVDTSTSGVTQMVKSGGAVYQENGSGDWWFKTSPVSAWTQIVPNSGTFSVTGNTTYNVTPLPFLPDPPQSVTINIAGRADLTMGQDVMSFGSLTVNAGSGSSATFGVQGSQFIDTKVLLNTNLAGSGNVSLYGSGTTGSSMTINGSVAAGLSFQLNGSGAAASTPEMLVLDQPTTFAASVTMIGTWNGTTTSGAAVLELAGLNANAYSIKGDILTLFNANKVVDTLSFNNDTYNTKEGSLSVGTAQFLTLEHNSQGVMISSTGADKYQPGGIGTVLTVHS
jgi:hypothetical protein